MVSILVNTLVFGGQLAVITLGLNFTYRVIGYPNWAHLEFVTVGAYLGLLAHRGFGLNLPLAAITAMVLTGLIAVLLERPIFRQVRSLSIGSKMLVSVGVAIVLRSMVQFFGGITARFYSDAMPTIAFRIGRTAVTENQAWIAVTALVSVALFFLLLHRTQIGRIVRAAADDFTLAQVRGINGILVSRWVWFTSGAYAALGGVLVGVESFVRPSLGLTLILPVFAAATVGGLGSLGGALVGSLLLAFAQNMMLAVDFGSLIGGDSWYIASGYKSTLALALLVGVILLRPRGLLARGTT